jgi:gamma-glutamyl-gamma-aminobutyrate hydrolase PuuD
VSSSDRPRIVVTVTVPTRHADVDLARRKNGLYAAAVMRHGGEPIVIDGSSSPDERAAAFRSMDGLLLTGGTDIDPARYGAPNLGSIDIEPERDEVEAEAWAAAGSREAPVLGICRGFQAINVFGGGTLLQDVGGHAGPGWSTGPARSHPLRLATASLLRDVVASDGADELTVNTYHHQAVRAADLAPGLIATAWADSEAGELIEAFEGPGDRFVVGLQCHPERTESTPAGFEALFARFVDACRRSEANTSVERSGRRGERLAETRNSA